MALRDQTPDGRPQFEDADVPCLQLCVLTGRFDDGTLLQVGTDQDDDVWGLRLRSAAGDEHAAADGIYRSRALTELPTGEVVSVSVWADHGVLAEVLLRFRGRPLLLVAGELEEDRDHRLWYHRLDESVLAFTDPSAAGSIHWIPERHRLRELTGGAT